MWNSDCITHMKKLVANLVSEGALRTREIIEAFLSVDRKDFIPPGYENEAYGDYPLPIGYGQTISQPTTVAFMLELLQPKKGEKILDVGSGSGWTTALLAKLVGPEGKVFGTEIIPPLTVFSQDNLAKYGFSWAKILQSGPGLGLPEEAPFDKILVSASAKNLPIELVGQLKVGGAMVIPIGYSVFRIVKKPDGKRETQEFPGFSFVPLIH